MTAYTISKTIFYSPATNGKAPESISNGEKLIKEYSKETILTFMLWLNKCDKIYTRIDNDKYWKVVDGMRVIMSFEELINEFYEGKNGI
jgi:hypothetical protein